MPISFDLVPLCDLTGVLGLLDPLKLYWYSRLHEVFDFTCAHDVFTGDHIATDLNCNGSPDDPDHNYACLTLRNLQELRFRLLFRVLFASLRADINLDELNQYATNHFQTFVSCRLFHSASTGASLL